MAECKALTVSAVKGLIEWCVSVSSVTCSVTARVKLSSLQ